MIHDPARPQPVTTVVLDLDGTLVDSVPVHVVAWQAAFRDIGLQVPSHRIHRAIGMGGDRLVEHVAGEAVESSLGDELRSRHPRHVDRLFGVIAPTEGATELLDALHSHWFNVVLASSSPPELTERLLDLVPGAYEHLDHVISGADVRRSKPHPEPVEKALAAAQAEVAVVVGDAVWDVEAAAHAGIPCIGLLTGGVSEDELRKAGAVAVHETPLTLARALNETGSLWAAGTPSHARRPTSSR